MKTVADVTDAEIEAAFRGTDFGVANLRNLLALSVMKKALRYYCGHTITEIMVRMGLTTAKGRVTNRGRSFCHDELGGKNGG